MNSNTKLIIVIQNFYEHASKKLTFFKIYFTNGLFFLFSGFLIGNLFGSLVNIFHKSIIWHGLVTILVLFFVEMTNYIIYHNKKRPLFLINVQKIVYYASKYLRYKLYFLKNYNPLQKILSFSFIINNVEKIFLKLNTLYTIFYKNIKKFFFIKTLNLFKVGILLGFFIDAFKVGS